MSLHVPTKAPIIKRLAVPKTTPIYVSLLEDAAVAADRYYAAAEQSRITIHPDFTPAGEALFIALRSLEVFIQRPPR